MKAGAAPLSPVVLEGRERSKEQQFVSAVVMEPATRSRLGRRMLWLLGEGPADTLPPPVGRMGGHRGRAVSAPPPLALPPASPRWRSSKWRSLLVLPQVLLLLVFTVCYNNS